MTLRLEVAKALGWVDEGHNFEWTSPNGYDRNIWDIPNWPHDETACFRDLVPKMTVSADRIEGYWNLSYDCNNVLPYLFEVVSFAGEVVTEVDASSPAEAICKAFLEVMSKDEE